MKLYKTSGKLNFVNEVAEYIIANFSCDYSNNKTILPTGFLCSYLHKTLINKIGTTILPSVVTLSEVVAEDQQIFDLNADSDFIMDFITPLEEKALLADIIHGYININYDILQATKISKQISALFFEFETNNIEIEQIKNIPILEQPEHWYQIFDFISYVYVQWKIKLKQIKKITPASYQKYMFECEFQKLLSNKTYSLLIAGIMPTNLYTKEFIKKVVALDNGHLILPPCPWDIKNISQEPADALYNIYSILNILGKEMGDFLPITKNIYVQSSVDRLLDENLLVENESSTNIAYIEFENIFHEAEYIAQICSKELESNLNSSESVNYKIAIILNKYDTKHLYINALDKYDLSYYDLIGKDILETNAIGFIIIMSKFICSEFNINNFLNLFNHPYISCSYSQKIEMMLSKKNRFVNNLEEIYILVQEYCDEEIVSWFRDIKTSLTREKYELKQKFNSILNYVLKVAESVYPNIWEENRKYKISESIAKIVKINWNIRLEDISVFPDLLEDILSDIKLFEDKDVVGNITFCKAEDASLVQFDTIIITNCNDGCLPSNKITTPWLNRHIQESIGLNSDDQMIGSSLYNFYLNLQNKNIIITRSKNQSGVKNALPSNFLLRLMAILRKNLKYYIAQQDSPKKISYIQNKGASAKTTFFPSSISVTDIELLIRAPYNFYAKKILSLKQKDILKDEVTLSEFGSIFHDIVDCYNKNYDSNLLQTASEKLVYFDSICDLTLDNSNYPQYTKEQWKAKIKAIANEFIEFDSIRRCYGAKIYTELKGSMTLDISGREISIIAVADRIEVIGSKAFIIDYKTGSVPTKQEIMNGLSPQLILESIILNHGGFANISNISTESIIYVKIGSSPPYINLTEISMTEDVLRSHKEGLVNLLEHYVNSMEFAIEQNITNYDNYFHLARREK